MPLHNRSIAGSAAVVCFFSVCIIGWANSLSPFTCCKRALIAAFLIYIAASLAVKSINAILINAMIKTQMEKRKEKADGSED